MLELEFSGSELGFEFLDAGVGGLQFDFKLALVSAAGGSCLGQLSLKSVDFSAEFVVFSSEGINGAVVIDSFVFGGNSTLFEFDESVLEDLNFGGSFANKAQETVPVVSRSFEISQNSHGFRGDGEVSGVDCAKSIKGASELGIVAQ